MKTRNAVAGALSASLLLGALPGMGLAQDAEVELTPEGVEWTLTTLAGDDVPAEVEVTLFLSGGEVVGNAGCNSYFGSYELAGDALTSPNPFGLTQKLCEDAVMAVEDAYLPTLQDTATWSIDEEGTLSLADAGGAEQLVYGEAPIDVTMSDVDALVATLGDLQAQIDAASAEVAAVAAETAAIPVNKFDKRVKAVERRADNQGERITDLDRKTKGLNVEGLKGRISTLEQRTKGLNVEGLRNRIAALETAVTRLDQTTNRLRERIAALEASDEAQEDRIEKLEEAVFVPTPS